MKCHTCGKDIVKLQDSILIIAPELSTVYLDESVLYHNHILFHKDCFLNIAGRKYIPR